MRKSLAAVAVAGLLPAACAEDEPTIGGETGATGATGATAATGATGMTAAATAADCAASATFVSAGTLTIGTDNPAYPPYIQGGTEKYSDWKFNDPNNGEGFESAVGYAVAGILLAVLLVGIVAAPFVFLYRKFAPKRFQDMQAEIRPIW